MTNWVCRCPIIAACLVSTWLQSLSAQIPAESLLTRLHSPDWEVRDDALNRLRLLSSTSRPAGYADAVLGLLDREVVDPGTEHGEGHGQYLLGVVDAALELGDPRAVRGLAILGTEMNRRVRDFVARQGSAALPYLDEAWNSPSSNHYFLVLTWALMLGQYKDRLSLPDQRSVLQRILSADSLDFVDAAVRVPMPEATPLVEAIANASGEQVLRASANQALISLRPMRDALSPAALAPKVADVLAALCLGAQGARATACTSLTNSLNSASANLTANQPGPARDTLQAVAARVDEGFQQGVWSDAERRLLGGNATYLTGRIAGTGATLYLHGSGSTANPATLSLSTGAPTATTAKYKDSPSINFSAGNAWAAVGTWTAAPGLSSGALTALGAAQLWLGLKNSDDIGTNFDVRVEAYKNGALVAAGQALCVQGLTLNASLAKTATVTFAPFSATVFNGTTDVLSLKVLTRIGTTSTGAACGGHSNAVGLRVYFDAASRAASFAATF